MMPRCTHPRLRHRFSPGSKLLFGTVVGWLTCWVMSYGSCDMEHAAPESVLRASKSPNASSELPGPPAGGRIKEGRYLTISSRHSTPAQLEAASLCLYFCCHHFCASPFCAGVNSGIPQLDSRGFPCGIPMGPGAMRIEALGGSTSRARFLKPGK